MPQQITEQEEFEKYVKSLLVDPKPEPRFNQWQRIKYCLSSGTVKTGTIVGLYWCSIPYAFHNSEEPGWWYVLEEGWNHYMMDEQLLIEGVEAVSEAQS